jgi:hypothetical protein
MATTRQRIQLRRDTAANWVAADPILLTGEAGVETDTNRLKIGDGITVWSLLPYVKSGDGFDGSITSLTDVSAINAVDGSLLVYDADTNQWVGGPSVTTLEVVNGGNF